MKSVYINPAMDAKQDWTPVTIRNQKIPSAAVVAGSRPHVSAAVSAAQRLDANDTPKPPSKSLSPECKQALIAARVAKGWNQTQLNTQCAFPLNTIRDIENGRLCPSPQQLTVLSRVLRVVMKYAS